MATIKEVARRAKVSVGTVSNVLSGTVPVSEKLRERVMQVVRTLDYHPNHVARSLKIRQTNMLGMVVPYLTNPFFPQVVRGAEDSAWKHGYMLLTFNCDNQVERERQVLAALRNRRVDGILLVPSTDEDIAHIRAAVEAGIPIVCLDRRLKDVALDSVTVDNVTGAQECVEHLIRTGHRRIATITGPLGLQISRDRLEGYQRALASAGIPFSEELVGEGHFRSDAGYDAAVKLLRDQHPTAFFSQNAMMTLGLLRALGEFRLRCPEDVAVGTFDDPDFSEALRPQLTSVAQPAYDLGYQGAELLLQRIADPERPATNLVLKTELRIRESTTGVKPEIAMELATPGGGL